MITPAAMALSQGSYECDSFLVQDYSVARNLGMVAEKAHRKGGGSHTIPICRRYDSVHGKT